MSSSSNSVLSAFLASPHFLRRVLWADAASGIATGVLQIAFADALAPLLGLPADLLLWSSYILAGFVLLISWTATRRTIPAGAVWVVIGCNALWVMGCAALLVSSQIAPTGFGIAFLIVNAVTVGVFLELEWIGVRKQQLAHAW